MYPEKPRQKKICILSPPPHYGQEFLILMIDNYNWWWWVFFSQTHNQAIQFYCYLDIAIIFFCWFNPFVTILWMNLFFPNFIWMNEFLYSLIIVVFFCFIHFSLRNICKYRKSSNTQSTTIIFGWCIYDGRWRST